MSEREWTGNRDFTGSKVMSFLGLQHITSSDKDGVDNDSLLLQVQSLKMGFLLTTCLFARNFLGHIRDDDAHYPP